jgi:hypothetical protein
VSIYQVIPASPGWHALDAIIAEGDPGKIEGFTLVPVIGWHLRFHKTDDFPVPEALPVVPGGMEPYGDPDEWVLRSPQGQFMPRDGTRAGDQEMAVQFLQEAHNRRTRRAESKA